MRAVSIVLCGAILLGGCATARQQRGGGIALLVAGALVEGVGAGIAYGASEDGNFPNEGFWAVSIAASALFTIGAILLLTVRTAHEPRSYTPPPAKSIRTRAHFYVPESNCKAKDCKPCPNYLRKKACEHYHTRCRLLSSDYYRPSCHGPKPHKGPHPALP